MSEIEQYQQPPESALIQWARDAQQAHAVAQSLSKTAFVSTTMKGRPEEITGAILTGAEIGLQPMSALRSIDIIQGTPAMRAHALRGLVQSRGHDIWVEAATDTRAVVCGQRKGSDKVQKSVWTIERAQKLGLTSKDNWRKQPQAMLVARATSEICRLVASDVILGLPYSAEELADEGQEEVKPKRTAKRKEPQPEPEAPALEPAEPEAEPEPVAEAEEPALDWPEVKESGADE